MFRSKWVFIFILISKFGFSQSISPQTQNIGGTLGTQNGYALTFSVGEMVSTTNFIATNSLSISSGFLQSNTPLVTNIFDLNIFGTSTIQISPNPTFNDITIKANSLKSGEYYIQIVDAASNIKYSDRIMVYSSQLYKIISVEHLVQGVYYLSINAKLSNGNTKSGLYKFIKL